MQNASAWRRSKAALWALAVLACLQIISQYGAVYNIVILLQLIITGRYPINTVAISDLGRIPETLCALIPAILLLVMAIRQLRKPKISKGGTLAYFIVYIICVLAMPIFYHLPPFYLYEARGIYSRTTWGLMQQLDPTAGINTPDLQVFYILPLLFAGLCVLALVWFFLSRAHWSGKLGLTVCLLGLLVTSRWFSIFYLVEYGIRGEVLSHVLTADFLRSDLWFILLHGATVLVYILSLKRVAAQPQAEEDMPADPLPA